MFYCYIYLESRVRISHREDFRIVETPESFDSVQNTFKIKCVAVNF